MRKMSEVTPIIVLSASPWSISRLNGDNPSLDDLVQHPLEATVFNTIRNFVKGGAMRYINQNVYLTRLNPIQLGIFSIPLKKDCTMEELIAKHLPTKETM